MCSLTGFRPPQFSEDDAWLPPWLQQCGIEQLNFEVTTELRCDSIVSGDSFRENGGCNIGQLYLSGTDGSPMSCAQSADNVVQFHLRLFSDECSEKTTDTCQTKSMSHCSTEHLENSADCLRQKANDLNYVHDSGAVSECPTEELETSVHEQLSHEESLNLSVATDDDVELCIGASEALVIDEVIKSDPSLKRQSASAILEVSLQLKQARLEVCDDLFNRSVDEISESSDLSDLDDSDMEYAYEDVGLCNEEFPGNSLSVSRVKDTPSVSWVKDTLDSECNENRKLDRTVSVTNYFKSQDESLMNKPEHVSAIQSENNVAAEFICDVTQNKVTDNLVYGLETDEPQYQNDCSSSSEARSGSRISVSEEKVHAPIEEKTCQENDGASSPVCSLRDAEKDKTIPTIFQERFQSRWLGGWTCNNQQNEMNCAIKVNHNIPGPFAGETSFFTESAPDGNSFVHHRDGLGAIASQLSTPSQNFPSNTNGGILLSQDFVRSSSESVLDPLCSVVPCSISEDVVLPAVNHNREVPTGHFSISTEQRKETLSGRSVSGNELAGVRVSPRVSRKFTSLKNYSKMPAIQAEVPVKDCHNQWPLRLDHNPDLASHDIPLNNIEETVRNVAAAPLSHNENSEVSASMQDNCDMTALPETMVKCTSTKNVRWKLSNCEKLDAPQTSKRVRFSENEINTAERKKLQKTHTTSNNCITNRVTRRTTRSSGHLDARCQQLSKYLKMRSDMCRKRLIFQNMKFVITGLSCKKEKEIEGLIRKYGGEVLSQVPSLNLKGKRSVRSKSQVLPVVICLKKIQSFKFLYGCAVNALILKVNWLIDSIASGLVLPPKKYMVLSRNIGRRDSQVYTALSVDQSSLVFNKLGVMLHGKTKKFPNIATIIKHGGGQVVNTLQKLVQSLEAGEISTGVIVTDDENSAFRHLKHCALEHNIPMKSVYWIIRSLYAGRLVPSNEKNKFSSPPAVKRQRFQESPQLSQEI